MGNYQQHSPQQPDPVSFMAMMQEQAQSLEESATGGGGGGGGEVLDIQMAGNIVGSSLDDNLSGSVQQSINEDMFGMPPNFQQQQRVMQPDVQHAATGSGVAGNVSVESLYRSPTPQQQYQQQEDIDNNGLSLILDQFFQKNSDSQQQTPVSLLTAVASVSPILPSCSITSHNSQGGLVNSNSVKEAFQFTTPSPVMSPPNPVLPADKHPQGNNQKQTPPEMVTSLIRVPSADELYSTPQSSRPPLERNRSEPIKLLQNKVTNLNAQCMRQMKELEKQQKIANTQYSEFLMQLMLSQQTKAKPSEKQKKILESVLSDTSLVKMLKTALLANQSSPDVQQKQEQQQQQLFMPPPSTPPSSLINAPLQLQLKKECLSNSTPSLTPLPSPSAAIGSEGSMARGSSPNILSPTTFAKV